MTTDGHQVDEKGFMSGTWTLPNDSPYKETPAKEERISHQTSECISIKETPSPAQMKLIPTPDFKEVPEIQSI